jgi:Tol biopolymer transport system component
VVGIDGSGLVRLANTPSSFEGAPSWGPDGVSLVYFSQQHNGYVTGFGGGAQQLMQTSTSNGIYVCPLAEYAVQAVLSARNELAVPCNSGLYRISASGASKVRLYEQENAVMHAPAWATLGVQLAFIEIIPGKLRVRSIRNDGSELKTLAETPSSTAPGALYIKMYSLCWSADNARLFFSVPEANGDAHIWMVRADGTGLQQITTRAGVRDHNVSCGRP